MNNEPNGSEPNGPQPNRPQANGPQANEPQANRPQPNNPLHGITLKAILEYLVERVGWAEMAHHVDINCFHRDPSINSSLKFLRTVGWARAKVERLYLRVRRQAGE